MSTKLSLAERLKQRSQEKKVQSEAKLQETKNDDQALINKLTQRQEDPERQIIAETRLIQPTVDAPTRFAVTTAEQRINNQRISRKKNPKTLVITGPIPPPSKSLAPRLLTDAEIDDVLLGIPIPARIRPEDLQRLTQFGERPRINYSSDPDISMVVYEDLLDYFRVMLKEIYLTPSAIPDLRRYMTMQFNLSRGIPGFTVGILSGDAISAPITQSTLNSFHSSGTSKSISYGIAYMEELIDASAKRKQTFNTIHFKNKYLSFDEVLEYRRSLVYLTVGNLVREYEILPSNELTTESWYRPYLDLYRIPISSHGLRLYLNLQLIFDHRIKISDIRDALIREKPSLITVVPSPTHRGIIDIYPVEASIGQVFDVIFRDREIEPTPIIFLQNFLRDTILDKIKIKGAENITNLFPVSVPIWAGVKNIQRIDDQTWNCIIDRRVLRINNLPIKRILELLQYLEFTIVRYDQDRIIVQMPEDYNKLNPLEYINYRIKDISRSSSFFGIAIALSNRLGTLEKVNDETWNYRFDNMLATFNIQQIGEFLSSLGFTILSQNLTSLSIRMPTDYDQIKKLNPTQYINSRIDMEKERVKEEYQNSSDFAPYPFSILLILSQYWSAETNGSNLEVLLGMRQLDHDIIISNDIHETKTILGIEGAKNLLQKEFIDALNSLGSGTDPRHVVLISDFMTNKGEYLGFTGKGVEEQETSAYEQASFERAQERLFENAIFGERVPVNSVTQSVFVGAEGGFGTNYNRVVISDEKRQEYINRIDEIDEVSVADAQAKLDVFEDIDIFTFSNPGIDISGETGESSELTRELLRQEPTNPINGTLGLPLNRSNLNVSINRNITPGIPKQFIGKLEEKRNTIAPIPIVSSLLTNSVNRISGIPGLDNPQPLKLPIPSNKILPRTDYNVLGAKGISQSRQSQLLPTERKTDIAYIAGSEANRQLDLKLQSEDDQKIAKTSFQRNTRIIGLPRIGDTISTTNTVVTDNTNTTSMMLFPRPGGADPTPIAGLTESKFSAVPIIPVTSKSPLENISINPKPNIGGSIRGIPASNVTARPTLRGVPQNVIANINAPPTTAPSIDLLSLWNE